MRIQNLFVEFGDGADRLMAVRDVSFNVREGEVFGIVGESGSGKSTILRAVSGLNGHWTGSIQIDGLTM